MVIITHFYSLSLFPEAWCFFTCLSLVLLGVGAWRLSSKKEGKRWELNTYNSEKYTCQSHQDHQECKHWDAMHCLWDHLRQEACWESGNICLMINKFDRMVGFLYIHSLAHLFKVYWPWLLWLKWLNYMCIFIPLLLLCSHNFLTEFQSSYGCLYHFWRIVVLHVQCLFKVKPQTDIRGF